MKVRATVEIGNGLRRLIGEGLPREKKTVRGLARRSAVVEWLNGRAKIANEDWRWMFPRPELSDREAEESAKAFEWLRAAGRPEAEIRGWILLQRAMLHFPKCNAEQGAYSP